MCKVLLFAGTTEGREIAGRLKDTKVKLTVSVATDYGETLIDKADNIKVVSERLNEEEMEKLLLKERFNLVIDATHPYAVEVTKNIKNSCENTGIKYLRVVRDSKNVCELNSVVYVNSVEEACEFLNTKEGNILAVTGSKEIDKYTAINNFTERVFARVLSTDDVVHKCNELGFKGRNLIAMQGPFSKEFNVALLKQIDAKFMVTKESGKAGGFDEKIAACRECDVTCIVIGRPINEEGVTVDEAVKYIKDNFNLYADKNISLVSIGLGNINYMTLEAREVFENCDIVIGADRMLKAVEIFNKPTFASYKSLEIIKFIEEHDEYKNIAIAYSGDAGFYSGAKIMLKKLSEYNVKVIPGISSVGYFSAKIKTSWEDMKLVSMHGKDANIVAEVLNNKKVFTLLGGENRSFRDVCRKLDSYGLGHVRVAVGCNLSYEDERIQEGYVKDFVDCIYKGLCVAVFFNDDYNKNIYKKVRDDEFIRDKVPMTKEEIRSLSIVKLGLKEDSVLYDIGAGTGSISVEAALNMPRGKVFAIERKEEAVNLIKRNKEKFKVDNLHVVKGLAPEALMNLDIPTHAFIGGSAGNLKEIIDILLYKNPKIKIVINAITLETVSQALDCVKHFTFEDVDVTQLGVAKNRIIGGFNMMTGQNPIYIITLKGAE